MRPMPRKPPGKIEMRVCEVLLALQAIGVLFIIGCWFYALCHWH